MWNDHHNKIIQGVHFNGNGHLHDDIPYKQWYISHTTRYLLPQQDTPEDYVS